MKKIIEFSRLSEFEKFEKENKEKGSLFKHIEYYIPIDINVTDFLAMEWIVLSFSDFIKQPLSLKISWETNELFIGDINLGGHGARCRLLKIPREDIYLNSSILMEWVDNDCYKLWGSGISVDERRPNLESLLEEDSPLEANLSTRKDGELIDDVKMLSPNGNNLNIEIYIEGIGAAYEAEHGYRKAVVDSAMSLDAFIQYALGFEGAFLASEYYMAAPDLCAVMKKESSGFKVICKQGIILKDLLVENEPLKVSFKINNVDEAVLHDRMDLLIEKGVKQLDDVEMAWLGAPIGTDVDDLLDELTDFPALQAIIQDGKPAIEEPPKEHWIIKLNFVLRLIRVLISPFR